MQVCQIYDEKSKYLNSVIDDLNSLSMHDLVETIDELIYFLQKNEISITVKNNQYRI